MRKLTSAAIKRLTNNSSYQKAINGIKTQINSRTNSNVYTKNPESIIDVLTKKEIPSGSNHKKGLKISIDSLQKSKVHQTTVNDKAEKSPKTKKTVNERSFGSNITKSANHETIKEFHPKKGNHKRTISDYTVNTHPFCKEKVLQNNYIMDNVKNLKIVSLDGKVISEQKDNVPYIPIPTTYITNYKIFINTTGAKGSMSKSLVNPKKINTITATNKNSDYLIPNEILNQKHSTKNGNQIKIKLDSSKNGSLISGIEVKPNKSANPSKTTTSHNKSNSEVNGENTHKKIQSVIKSIKLASQKASNSVKPSSPERNEQYLTTIKINSSQIQGSMLKNIKLKNKNVNMNISKQSYENSGLNRIKVNNIKEMNNKMFKTVTHTNTNSIDITNISIDKNDNNLLISQIEEKNIPSSSVIQYGMTEHLKEERASLIKEISMYIKKYGKMPTTTTRFYRIGKMLGKGAFGKVNIGIHKLTGKYVAIKCISKKAMNINKHNSEKVKKEVDILEQLKSSSIIRLFETFESEKYMLLVEELCVGGDLLTYLRKRRRLKENMAKIIFKQIIEGLNHCHNKNVLHRDIKLDNILLNSEGKIKVLIK